MHIRLHLEARVADSSSSKQQRTAVLQCVDKQASMAAWEVNSTEGAPCKVVCLDILTAVEASQRELQHQNIAHRLLRDHWIELLQATVAPAK